jgi:hypothetical protein
MVDRRRQWRAENQDIEIKRSLSEQRFVVEGSRGDEYIVDVALPLCSCPDWKKREPDGGCKHILKAKVEIGIVDTLPSPETSGSPRCDRGRSYSGDWRKICNRVKKRDHWTCQKCQIRGGTAGTAELHVHQIVPRSKSGEDSTDNLITLCEDCHRREHSHQIESPDTTITSSDSTPSSSRLSTSNSGDSFATNSDSAESASGYGESHSVNRTNDWGYEVQTGISPQSPYYGVTKRSTSSEDLPRDASANRDAESRPQDSESTRTGSEPLEPDENKLLLEGLASILLKCLFILVALLLIDLLIFGRGLGLINSIQSGISVTAIDWITSIFALR